MKSQHRLLHSHCYESEYPTVCDRASLPTPLHVTGLFAWLRDLVRNQNVPLLKRHLPEPALEVIAQALNMGADADSITCLLLACSTPNGWDFYHIRCAC